MRRHAWNAKGRNFSLYKADRQYITGEKPNVHTELIHADAGTKMSVAHKVYRSPMRYGAMRIESASRPDLSEHSKVGTDERVGPGKYDPSPTKSRPGYSIDGSAAFVSGELRIPPNSFSLPHRTAEPAFSSVQLDKTAWVKKANGQGKGVSWTRSQRFQRQPGPGSNVPEHKPPPGPGSYLKLHSWPTSGYMGTAKGFNHYGR